MKRWHVIRKDSKDIILATNKFKRLEKLARSLISKKTDMYFQIQYFKRMELFETVDIDVYFNVDKYCSSE